jgi:hypothetical protein
MRPLREAVERRERDPEPAGEHGIGTADYPGLLLLDGEEARVERPVVGRAEYDTVPLGAIVKCCGRELIQAASFTSIPSTNFTPRIASFRRLDPFNNLHFFDAASISLKTIVRHAARLPLPLVRS